MNPSLRMLYCITETKCQFFPHPKSELKNVSIAKYKKLPVASKMSTHCSAPDVMHVIATSIVNTKYRRNLLMVKKFVSDM